MKHPSLWNKSDLHHHLQHALNLELWTIPLYLTSLYSIKGLKDLKHQEYPEAAKLIFSVVVQEMLHLELVCNLSNAFGFSPRFIPPCYDEHKGIPFIHPDKKYVPPELTGYSVKPQALNENSLRLFCAIEMPHPVNEFNWQNEKAYNSICDLYNALKSAISYLWEECYVGNANNTKQKNSFGEYHNRQGRNHGFSQVVNSAETACRAINAIIEQGEGANSKHVPVDFRPPHPEAGKEFDISWHKGHLSHYQKFRILLHSHRKLPMVYEQIDGIINIEIQQNMRMLFLDFLSAMQIHFNEHGDNLPDSFWRKMFSFGKSIIAVWESGSCPDFNFEPSHDIG